MQKFREQGILNDNIRDQNDNNIREDLQTMKDMTDADFEKTGVNIATRMKIRNLTADDVYKAFPKTPNETEPNLRKLRFPPRDIKDGDEFWVDVSLEGSDLPRLAQCQASELLVCSESFEQS